MNRTVILALAITLAVPAVAQDAGKDGKVNAKPPSYADLAADPGDLPTGPLPPDLADLMAPAVVPPGNDPIVAVLARPDVKAQVLDLALAQVRFPDAVMPPLRAALEELLENPDARVALAVELRASFDGFGFTAPLDDQIARVAATMLPTWALDGVALGLPRLPVADQRAVLATRLAIAESLSPDRCESYLSDWATDARAIEMSAIAAMPPDRAAATLTGLMAASLAEYRNDPAYVVIEPAAEDRARQALGAAIMAAVDANPDPDGLIAALSPNAYGDPTDACAARVLVLRTALDLPLPDGDQAVRLIADYGLDGS